MKKFTEYLGIIALTTIIGFGVTGCSTGGGDDNPFEGTWRNNAEGIVLVCTDTTWDWTAGGDHFQGTYSRSGNKANYLVDGSMVGTATTNGNTMTGNVQGYGDFIVYKDDGEFENGGEVDLGSFRNDEWNNDPNVSVFKNDLSSSALKAAQKEGAMLVLELSKKPNNLFRLIWQNYPEWDWQESTIMDDGNIIAGKGVTWDESTKTLTILLSAALDDYNNFLKQSSNVSFFIQDWGKEITINSSKIVVPSSNNNGGEVDLGNYHHIDNNEIKYRTAVYTLSSSALQAAKKEGAKLVVELSVAPTSEMTLEWNGSTDHSWEKHVDWNYVLLPNGNPNAENGVSWDPSTKKLSMLLSQAIVDYSSFLKQSSLDITLFSMQNISELGIKSAKIVVPSSNNNNGGGGTQTGLYMGVIGFNDTITSRTISALNSGNKGDFKGFINNLSMQNNTGLYYAVDNAITMLQNATLPNDLVNVSVITFTDGLDNASTALNTSYASREAYRTAVNNRIKNETVKSVNITAYSIGVNNDAIVDTAGFTASLTALASAPGNVKELSDMTTLNSTFTAIANSLYNEWHVQTITLRMPGGVDNGTKIRFTFDSVSDAAASTFYIEGTYTYNGSARSLTSVTYHGLSSSSGTTVNGTLSGANVTFTFENTRTSPAGTDVNMSNAKQWEQLSSSAWQQNVEFNPSSDSQTTVEQKSAVIMLVLDCTTSLGSTGFTQMKTAANGFIDALTE